MESSSFIHRFIALIPFPRYFVGSESCRWIANMLVSHLVCLHSKPGGTILIAIAGILSRAQESAGRSESKCHLSRVEMLTVEVNRPDFSNDGHSDYQKAWSDPCHPYHSVCSLCSTLGKLAYGILSHFVNFAEGCVSSYL